MGRVVELELERGGEFTPSFLPWADGGKCDLPSANTYRYKANVRATDKKLDDHGFIIDNGLIQEHMEHLFSQSPQISCERMASYAARSLWDRLAEVGVDLRCVTVMIGGSNGAWITARCLDEVALAYDQGTSKSKGGRI